MEEEYIFDYVIPQLSAIPWYLRLIHFRRLVRSRSLLSGLGDELDRKLWEMSGGLLKYKERLRYRRSEFSKGENLAYVFNALKDTPADRLRALLLERILSREEALLRRRMTEAKDTIQVLLSLVQSFIVQEFGEDGLDVKELEQLRINREEIKNDVFLLMRYGNDIKDVQQNLTDEYRLRIHCLRASTMVTSVAECLRHTVSSEQAYWTARVKYISGPLAKLVGELGGPEYTVRILIDMPQGEILKSSIDGPDVFFISPYILERILENCSPDELSIIQSYLVSPTSENIVCIWSIMLSHVHIEYSHSHGSSGAGHGSVIGHGPGMHSQRIRG